MIYPTESSLLLRCEEEKEQDRKSVPEREREGVEGEEGRILIEARKTNSERETVGGGRGADVEKRDGEKGTGEKIRRKGGEGGEERAEKREVAKRAKRRKRRRRPIRGGKREESEKKREETRSGRERWSRGVERSDEERATKTDRGVFTARDDS